MLESALGAPQNLYAYGQADVSTRAGWALLAAAYWFHVSMNHPFIDGNKRASLMCCLAFLNTNGFDLEMSYEAGLELSIAIATHGISRDELATKLIPLLVAVVE